MLYKYTAEMYESINSSLNIAEITQDYDLIMNLTQETLQNINSYQLLLDTISILEQQGVSKNCIVKTVNQL